MKLTPHQWMLLLIVAFFVVAIGPLNIVLLIILIIAEAVMLSLAIWVLSILALIVWMAFKYAGSK